VGEVPADRPKAPDSWQNRRHRPATACHDTLGPGFRLRQADRRIRKVGHFDRHKPPDSAAKFEFEDSL
jgi:hypothetical protein